MFWTYSGLHLIFTYIPFKVQMFLTLWKPYVMFLLNSLVCSLNCLSYGNVIRSISCLCNLDYLSCGNVICGTVVVCLTAFTIVGTANGSTLPLTVFYAFKFVLSCSLFTPQLEAPPSSTLFFLLKALFGECVTTFFLFSSDVHISSLVTLANGFYGLSF